MPLQHRLGWQVWLLEFLRPHYQRSVIITTFRRGCAVKIRTNVGVAQAKRRHILVATQYLAKNGMPEVEMFRGRSGDKEL